MLVDNRRWRDKEFAEEQRRREKKMVAERERHKWEVEARMAEIRVTLVSRSGSMGGEQTMVSNELKVAKLTDRDNIKAFLVTFERLMEAYEVPKARWAYKLATQLTGRAQQAYATMSSEVSGDYNEVKAAILRQYDITEETYALAKI